MQSLTIQPIAEQPDEESTALYPDYLIGCLLREGIGRIAAGRSAIKGEAVDFVFTHRENGESKVFARVGHGYFRSVLARFGAGCQIENLYCGHALLSCAYERQGRIRLHRFSLFICNEPSMAVWLKLYLYSIEGHDGLVNERVTNVVHDRCG